MCIAKTVKCYVVHQSKVKAKTRNRTILPCCQMFGTALGVFLHFLPFGDEKHRQYGMTRSIV